MVKFFRPSPLELAQQSHARGRLDTGIVGTPVAEGRRGVPTTFSAADVHSPQVFVSHPRIGALVDQDAVGIQTSRPSLPGRPIAGWDGEAGAASPISGAY